MNPPEPPEAADGDPDLQPLREAERPEPEPAFMEALRQRMRATHHANVARHRARWRWVLPLTTGGLAAAAVLVFLLLPTASLGLAQVRESLRAAKTVAFDARLVIDRPRVPADLLVIRTWLDQEVGVRNRAEVLGLPGAGVESVARWDGDAWVINHVSRQWARTQTGRGVERWLRGLDPARLLLDLRDEAGITATLLHEATMPGTRAFTLSGEALDLPEGASLVLRVDERTRLPIELTYTLPPTPEGGVRLVLDGFAWGAPIEPALFEPPSGVDPLREVASVDELFPEVSEATLLDALRDFARLSGGYYPGHPRAETILAALLLSSGDRSGDTAALAALVGAPLREGDLLQRLVAGGLYLLDLAQRGAEPVYHGNRVTAGHPDATLLVWRTRDGGERRITGSLDITTMHETRRSMTPR